MLHQLSCHLGNTTAVKSGQDEVIRAIKTACRKLSLRYRSAYFVAPRLSPTEFLSMLCCLMLLKTKLSNNNRIKLL